jgi:hypothetical protein
LRARNLFGITHRTFLPGRGGTTIFIIYRCDKNKLLPLSGCRSFIDIFNRPAVPMNNSVVLPDSPPAGSLTRAAAR